MLMLSLLMSCASNKVTSSKQPRAGSKQVVQAEEMNAQYYLQQAKASEPEQATELLLSAAKQYLIEKNYAKSLWLSQQLLALSSDADQRYQILLVKAENLLRLAQFEQALSALKQAQRLADDNLQLNYHYFSLLAEVQSHRALPLAATDANLRAFALNPQQSEQAIEQLWLQLNVLSQWQIDQLVALNPPHIEGWQQLLNFAHRFGYQPANFNRYLTQWLRNYPNHPAKLIASRLMTSDALALDDYQNIAVILPLSGKLKSAGESAQQGILASYHNNPEKQLHFIDAEQLDFTTLNETLTRLNIDYVIGPLLKANVDAYLAQPELTVPTLLLNLPETQQIKAQDIVFSMDPKDEPIQAATTLSRKQFKHPIILSQQDNVSKRIATTFAQQWLKITGISPEIIIFDDPKNMQEQLKENLGIAQSQDRIDDIDKRIRQKLKTETRNRRDIDMIYLVGTPNETRLLKPYIDVNISPFADAIPIFSSSRSHSDNADSSDSRDLTGLQFTEMPWLLDSKQQNKSLKQLSETIWPDRNDSLKRIFAMGYDSLSLIEKFHLLKTTPYVRHYGQTGILKLNEQGVLTRSLLWGSYQKDRVEQIAMD